MKIAEDDRERVALMLEAGDKLGAVRYLQEAFSLTAEEALGIAEKLDRAAPSETVAATQRGPRVAAAILTVAGFLLLSVGFIFGFRDYKFTINAVPVVGKVVAIAVSPPGVSESFAPVIEYQWMGQEIHFKGRTQSTGPAFAVGDEVQMLLDPDKPAEPRMDSLFDRWFVIIVLAVLGFTFSILGFLVRKLMT